MNRAEQETKARKLLARHFPDSDIRPEDLHLVHPLHLCWSTDTAVHKRSDLETLNRMESALKSLSKDWAKLSPLAQKSLHGEMYGKHFNLRTLLRQAIFVGLGRDPMRKRDGSGFGPNSFGAIRSARMAVQDAEDLHHHARDAEHAIKIKIAEAAQELWQRYRGEPGPRKPSPGTAFYELVGDLITAAEKDYSVQSVLKAYGRVTAK